MSEGTTSPADVYYDPHDLQIDVDPFPVVLQDHELQLERPSLQLAGLLEDLVYGRNGEREADRA